MRTLVIGDIHGGFLALEQVLKRANVSTNDTLIFIGDYVDGWSDAFKTISFLIQLRKSTSCIFLKGNHEELFYNSFFKNIKNPLWLQHGGTATLNSYNSADYNTLKQHREFLESLQFYYIDSENNLFCHAGFTHHRGPQYEYYKNLVCWDRTLWETACVVPTDMPQTHPLYPKRLLCFNQIFIGHTPVTRIGKTTPTQCANVWNVDTGAAFKGPISVLDINTKEFWQSDPVYTLYPKEKGRN